jgi:uncharacterized membrane protein
MAGPLDKVLHPYDQKKVVDTIAAAERLSAGEIAVHVEGRVPGGDPIKRGQMLLTKLGVTRTRERNGVLIYAAVRDRRFAIIADSGINEPPNSPVWQEANHRMTIAFRRGAFGDGLCEGIKSVGRQLAQRFPRQADDKNEVSNDITTDETAL